jgi:hypothetical protein
MENNKNPADVAVGNIGRIKKKFSSWSWPSRLEWMRFRRNPKPVPSDLRELSPETHEIKPKSLFLATIKEKFLTFFAATDEENGVKLSSEDHKIIPSGTGSESNHVNSGPEADAGKLKKSFCPYKKCLTLIENHLQETPNRQLHNSIKNRAHTTLKDRPHKTLKDRS